MNPELKNKIQTLLNHKKTRLSKWLNLCQQWNEEIGTLERLIDFEKDEEVLLAILGWLSINRSEFKSTRVIKENLTETIAKEVSLMEKSNLLAPYLTKEELLAEIRKRLAQGEIDENELVN